VPITGVVPVLKTKVVVWIDDFAIASLKVTEIELVTGTLGKSNGS
jgi:hypothetical protein